MLIVGEETRESGGAGFCSHLACRIRLKDCKEPRIPRFRQGFRAESKEDIQDEGMATTAVPKIPDSSDLVASSYL